MGRLTEKTRVTRVRTGGPVTVSTRADTLAVEEPLQIRVGGTDLITTMRTPGHDIELAHGLLHARGMITARTDVAGARYCAGAAGPGGENTYNTLDVSLRDPGAHRPVPVTAPAATFCPSLPVGVPTDDGGSHELTGQDTPGSGMTCGISAATTLSGLTARQRYTLSPARPAPELIASMPATLESGHEVYRRTRGAVHLAGAFAGDGRPLVVREDLGHLSAVDKVIGALLLDDRLPGDVHRRVAAELPTRAVEPRVEPETAPDVPVYLVTDSRASFDLVGRAVLAGFSGVIATSAATAPAVELARRSGLLLTGFTAADGFTLYSGELG